MAPSRSTPKAGDQFADALARVRARFVDSIPDRLEEIGCQFERISDGEDLADCLHGIERELHKVAGIAGSIGLGDLGAKSARAEAMLIDERTGEPGSVGVEKVFEAVVDLTEDLKAVQANSPA
ncbi:Hpt domain-containing protein [Gymnodinialimonas sp. 57CJ19]|uniref:Hpt domain-containing protein n=1 Tax=Gymnodinialimonas sp. 57CJ19 TaxID=3138498 RepID=UPI0031345296